MIEYMLLISRQGKVRLAKWYKAINRKEQSRVTKDVTNMVLARPSKMCNFLEWRDGKVIYKRYASLYFVCFVGNQVNELMALEVIHHFVEALDRYFGNVCELDVIFNFHKAYWILDEIILAGELQETSKKQILDTLARMDAMMEPAKPDGITRRLEGNRGNGDDL